MATLLPSVVNMKTGSAFATNYGPWALIAGASEGIGAAFAESLAQRGLNVVLVARRQEPLQALAQKIIENYKVAVEIIAADLAEPNATEIINQATTHLDIGLVVYNAAYSIIGSFLDATPEDHARVVHVNCRGPVLIAHAFGGRMRNRKTNSATRGGIILLSSLTAFQGTPLIANYGATKAYNLVLGEGLWYELGKQGIDVIACCAGATLTPGYIGSKPEQKTSAFAPPEMEPKAVAEETLHKLGAAPYLIPGTANKIASFFMRRLVTRAMAVRVMGNATEALYGQKTKKKM